MSWYSERPIKATRKPHKCAGCLHAISAGSSALYISGYDPTYNDDPFFGHYHPECRVAENAANDAAGILSTDEWTPLHEHAADDPEWLLENFPAVAARFNIGDAA